MHMANELLSIPVAGGTLAVAAAGLGLVCRKVRHVLTADKLALMGILGAFVFAGQMVNFQLPVMPGTSGHMVGAVLLAIVLGPHLAAIVMASVVIVQCLIFQDGGLLALGCNIINMALVPAYLGYYLYRAVTLRSSSSGRVYAGAMLACVVSIEAGAILVPIQAALAGVLVIPFLTFLITMIGVHLLVGLVYLQQVRPDIVVDSLPGKARLSRRAVLATLVVFTIVIAGGVSLLASNLPDGLEWSYAERPDRPGFEPAVSNADERIAVVDDFQSKYSPMPDYSARASKLGQAPHDEAEVAAGWTSLAGVLGSAITMGAIWLGALILRKRRSPGG